MPAIITQPNTEATPSALCFIPILLEQKEDGVYVFAYCPFCDKEEKVKIDFPGQPRNEVASVARIRAHLRTKHHKTAL